MANPHTTSAYSSPPTFTDTDKFNGTNWMEWKSTITVAARLRGIRGYLEGRITITPMPTIQITTADSTTTAPTPAATPWTSEQPSQDEWDTHDAWAMALIVYNVKNPVRLGVKVDGTSAEAWKSLTSQYDISTDLAKVNAQCELRNTMFHDGDDPLTHISNLRTLWTRANSVGSKIDDTDFCTIILTSLPASWDTLVATLYDANTSADAIARITMHWSRINWNRSVATPGSSTIALKVDTKSIKICANPNCKRRGHLITDCYWKGGGKEGQFPPGFGQRGGRTGSALAAVTGSGTAPPSTTANVAITETAYMLMAMTEMERGQQDGNQGYMVSDIPGEDYSDVRIFMAGGLTSELVTYADSGASNHCFANKSDFSVYELFPETREGQAASRTARFKIVGKGTVIKTFVSEGRRTMVTFKDALHTPNFTANLISVSRFDTAGFKVIFERGHATFYDPSGHPFISAKHAHGMYLMSVTETNAMSAKSHEKPISIDGWHRRFAHAGTSLIENMGKKGLVDGLGIIKGDKLAGMCEDCIYGKQVSRPHDEVVIPETKVLARVHTDLWGPARVQSTGGAKYLMLFTDDASSYWKAFFLSEKMGPGVLDAMKQFHVEAELQMGKRLKRFRLDMGKEFLNNASEDWCKGQGIILESPAPYAHASNGVPERSNRTALEGVRCLLSDSGLPPSLWADAAATVIYTRNFIPSSHHHDKVPAETWTGRRQDVSHLCPFGCTAYTKVPKEVNPSKLDNTSIKYFLIGYYGRDTYKLYNRQTGKVIKSRNMVFEEGEGHRTLPIPRDVDYGMEDYEIFSHGDGAKDISDDVGINGPGHVIHDRYPVAARNHPTDAPHHDHQLDREPN